LKSDVEGLYEAVSKFSKHIYDKHSLNMTKFYTLPSLSIAIYFSDYHDLDNNIKMIRGQVEKDIRSAYHGGIVNVYSKEEVKDAFYYDMNSQYPFAMLKDMPLGNPIFSTEKILDNVFGFVYGKINPPKEDILKNLTIEHLVNGQIILPREPFYR